MKFSPITITITIESLSELKALWARTYLQSSVVNNNLGIGWLANDEELEDLWESMDALCTDMGLKSGLSNER